MQTDTAAELGDLATVHEVEVKYRIEDTGALVDILTGRGVSLTDPLTQDDQAYAPNDWSYGRSKIGVAFARLRTQGGVHVFTVKTPVDNEMACLEYETVVADRVQMHAALIAMGYTATVRIVKTRRTGRLGAMSVCVDVVVGLGTFLEVEHLVGPEDSGQVIQVALDRFVRSLGIATERVYDTYDSLIRNANLEQDVLAG